jgi:hypothetical protein
MVVSQVLQLLVKKNNLETAVPLNIAIIFTLKGRVAHQRKSNYKQQLHTFTLSVNSLKFFMIPPVLDLYPQWPGYIALVMAR